MHARTEHWHVVVTSFFLLLLGSSTSGASPQPTPQTNAVGTVSFLTSDIEGPGVCHIPTWSRRIEVVKRSKDKILGSPCLMHNPSQMVFTRVPSATTFTFVSYTNGFGCLEGTPEKYRISFKTRGEYTKDGETPWNIQDLLRTARTGKTMDDNFQATQRQVQSDVGDNYDYLGNLSCIFISDPN